MLYLVFCTVSGLPVVLLGLQRAQLLSVCYWEPWGYDWNTGSLGKSSDRRRPSSTTRVCGYLGDRPLSCTVRRVSSSLSLIHTHVFRTTTTHTPSKSAAVLSLRVRPSANIYISNINDLMIRPILPTLIVEWI